MALANRSHLLTPAQRAATVGELIHIWEEALSTLELKDKDQIVFTSLVNHYSEPHRHYHTLNHLLSVLKYIDHLAPKLETALSNSALANVKVAAFFHDVIYQTIGQVDNEALSATAARQALTKIGADDVLISEVARLIELTREHRPAPEDIAGILLVDADLAILASGWDDYLSYVNGVRLEYDCTEGEWIQGRSQALNHLLEQPLFSLPNSQEKEDMAKANIRWELFELELRSKHEPS